MLQQNKFLHADRVFSFAKGQIVSSLENPEPFVGSSWKRCLESLGLDPSGEYRPNILPTEKFHEHREPHEEFLHNAKPLLASLCRQIGNEESFVSLTDAHGVTLEYLEHQNFPRQLKPSFNPLGEVLDESRLGTNGVGVCLREKAPLSIHKNDHFFSSHIHQTCMVSPIFDAQGQLAAVLNATLASGAETRASLFPYLQLVDLYARRIEKMNFYREFQKELILSLSLCRELAGDVLTENILAVSREGRICGANKNALHFLQNRCGRELLHQPISEILETSLAELMSYAGHPADSQWPVRTLGRGLQFFATLQAPNTDVPRTTPKSVPLVRRSKGEALLRPSLGLNSLAGEDPRLSYNVACLRRIMNKNISVILNGETGTGKEAFAQAIHWESERSQAPFVAMNCAAIPESLIESELFGYKEGAFTGARSKGMRGKILQAHGGTLFLDEIGDMPLQLQTRLLRVLAEKEVLPLGSETPIKVDLHVICATHRDLKALVTQGGFREDLYYRLNGVSLLLPPLRDRGDIRRVIQNALAAELDQEHDLQELVIDKEAMAVLEAYRWPGNIRQLRSVLRFALAMSNGDKITLNCLPAEVLQNSEPEPQQILDEVQPCAALADDLSDLGLKPMEYSEYMIVSAALKKHKWNITDAANELGIARTTIYRKMKQFQIVPPNLQ